MANITKYPQNYTTQNKQKFYEHKRHQQRQNEDKKSSEVRLVKKITFNLVLSSSTQMHQILPPQTGNSFQAMEIYEPRAGGKYMRINWNISEIQIKVTLFFNNFTGVHIQSHQKNAINSGKNDWLPFPFRIICSILYYNDTMANTSTYRLSIYLPPIHD